MQEVVLFETILSKETGIVEHDVYRKLILLLHWDHPYNRGRANQPLH